MKRIVLLALLGAAAGFLASFLAPERYTSEAVMTFDDFGAPPETVDARRMEFFTQSRAETLSAPSLSGIIQGSADLYPDLRGGRLEDAIEMMRKNLDISLDRPVGQPRSAFTFTIRFRYSDPVKARDGVRAVASKMIDTSTIWTREKEVAPASADADLSRQIEWLEAKTSDMEAKLSIPGGSAQHSHESGSPKRLSMQLLDPPTTPVSPDFDWHKALAISGACTGLALGLYWHHRQKAAHVL